MLIFLKLVNALLQFPGIHLFLLLLVIYYYLRSNEGMVLVFLNIAILTLYGLSIPIISNNLIDKLEQKYKYVNVEEVISNKNPKAIVALVAGSSYENNLLLNQYIAKIYKNNPVPILYSSYSLDKYVEPIPEDINVKLLSKALSSDFNIINQIWLSTEGKSYKQSINLVQDVLKKNAIDEVFLLTNAWHMQQAEWYCKQLNIKASLIPIITVIPKLPVNENYKNFIPNMQSLIHSNLVLQEGIDFIFSQIVNIFMANKN